MRRFIKYFLRFLLVILVLLFIAYYTLLHTQVGARWSIKFFTSQLPLDIGSIEGTLAKQIKLNNVAYKDDKTVVKVKQFQYEIESIHWFSKKVNVKNILLQDTDIQLLTTGDALQSKAETGFEGFSVPIALNIDLLKLNNTNINTDGSRQHLKQVEIAAYINQQDVNVSKLIIMAENISIQSNTSLKLAPTLPFLVNIDWQAFDDSHSVSGQGSINGNLKTITLDNEINLSKGQLTGLLNLRTTINLQQATPQINGEVTSDELLLNIPNQEPISIQKLETSLIGDSENYQLLTQLNFASNGIELTEILLQGTGNSESINFEKLSLNNSQGKLNLPTQLSWKDTLISTSQIELVQFDPSLYVADWPGLVNGTAEVKSSYDSNGNYLINIENAHFIGHLKNKDLVLKGNAVIADTNIDIMDTHLMLGNNQVNLNATVKNNKIEALIDLAFNDLSTFDQQLSGSLNTELKMAGDINNPNIAGQLQASKLKYQDILLDNLNLDANGNWSNQMTLTAKANGVTAANQQLNQVEVRLNGNRDKHEIMISIDEDNVSSELNVEGSLITQANHWVGTVLKNQIYLKEIDSTWNLKEPFIIDYKKDLNLSQACWLNQDTSGDICLDVAISDQNKKQNINLELNKLNIKFLEIFLPNDLNITGKLDGNAQINLFENNVSLDSNIELIDGKVKAFINSKQPYQTQITTASLTAKQENQNSKIEMLVILDDGTQLDFNFDLFKNFNNPIEINGNITGIFVNTGYLALLSEEIEELKGDFSINGSVKGPVNNLKTGFNANQEKGYLILSQSKSKLENLNFELSKESNQDSRFKLNGTAGEGTFASAGVLSIENDQSDTQWQLNADIKGDNMRLLTLPEIELNITPDLQISANNKGALISGDIKIPFAKLNIKQLPESTITASPDVIVHSNNTIKQELDEYLVNFDVKAQIEKPIKVDVLGLKSDLEGNLRVTNTENSIINGYGSLNLINGKYSIYGQQLDISKGALFFNGAIDNPSLDVVASRKSISGDVTAGVELGGTVNFLQSSLYSDPLLSDLEILSYILSGRGLNEDSDTSTQQLAQAAILLGLKKSSPIFSEIQSKLGIDVLTIKEGATAKDSIVEAGKQFNEKLYVGYNQGLFNRIGFWVLRYKINQALRLETTQGENQSVDLIYVRKKK
ncbi:MAG: translocation/assembly module TamB domain-containing protein [Marinicellaceae bacterium]